MEKIINHCSCIYDSINWILYKINFVVINLGFSIIILTIFIKFVFLPLSYTSYKTISSLRKIKHKTNTIEIKKRSEELKKIYTKEKINPFNCCLAFILQTPIFISLYWTLTNSILIKNSPFILWIKDLSIMDPYFILPTIMGLSILFQQKINNKEKKDNKIKLMPIIFTLFFLWFPSCLLIYWITNNLISIIQQYLIINNYE